jgi:hypothetical protein
MNAWSGTEQNFHLSRLKKKEFSGAGKSKIIQYPSHKRQRQRLLVSSYSRTKFSFLPKNKKKFSNKAGLQAEIFPDSAV